MRPRRSASARQLLAFWPVFCFVTMNFVRYKNRVGHSPYVRTYVRTYGRTPASTRYAAPRESIARPGQVSSVRARAPPRRRRHRGGEAVAAALLLLGDRLPSLRLPRWLPDAALRSSQRHLPRQPPPHPAAAAAAAAAVAAVVAVAAAAAAVRPPLVCERRWP
jgi:hypothetical protein